MRLMFVTPRRAEGAVGGREQLSALHESSLTALLGSALTVRKLDPAPPQGVLGILDASHGRIDGVTEASERAVVDEVIASSVDTLWLDGTNLGRLAAAVKRAAPAIRVISFAHNVEARFFLGRLRHRPGPRTLAVLIANLAAERLAVRSSDLILALNARDSALFKRVFGRAATHLLPMAIDDSGPPPRTAREPGGGLLFVGGAFYANLAGIRWFAAKVAPRLAVRTTVVGGGFESYKAELEACGKIDVAGGVANLTPFYAAACAVIAPIFDGSGMKTKVAEALMYGKPVIGTREAFSGYEPIASRAGWLADSADAWVRAVSYMAADPRPAFDPALREIYERLYSPAALSTKIFTILDMDS